MGVGPLQQYDCHCRWCSHSRMFCTATSLNTGCNTPVVDLAKCDPDSDMEVYNSLNTAAMDSSPMTPR